MNKKDTENQNLITITVPTYNRVEKLKRCIDSIRGQTCSDFDLVISDNASTDGTKEYLDDFGSKPNATIHFSETNVGPIKTLEKCIEMAKTDWVVFVADDDWCSPEFVSTMIPVLDKTKSAIVAPGFDGRDSEGKLLYTHMLESRYFNPEEFLLEMLYRPNGERIYVAGIAGFAMRRNPLQDYLPMKTYPGGFYTDTYFFWGLAMQGGIETINKLLYTRTEWEGSGTNTRRSYDDRGCGRKLFINDFRSLLLSKSVSWDSDKRDAILNALRLYEKNPPPEFTIRGRLGRIGMIRSLLLWDFDLVKRSRKKLKECLSINQGCKR